MKKTLSQKTRRLLALGMPLVAAALVLASCAQAASPTSTEATTTKNTTAATAATTTNTTTTTTTAATVQLVDADEALAILDNKPDALLIDVRTEAEFKSGHIEGALLLPIDQLQAKLSELPKDKATPLVVYCRSGNRSATAAQILLQAGYSQVYDLGGIIDWPYGVVTE
ncbi:MAG: rhodanese-like domain-containing protein [Eubacteriales bacterium]|jgi:rhodanese-related sulfurtransferase|nr:rhodanese-like domain-containing protein [Eubacteriales bacterium]MDD4139280.1 rhodanese-like domain-containing protein [Eubacteriales bacterium]MDD4743282.1 rhodanese-like domain-containing protein [Eubacteriales bacterium]